MFSIQANLKDQLEDIQLAIDVMCRLTKNIDEMMVVDRLRGFDVTIIIFHISPNPSRHAP